MKKTKFAVLFTALVTMLGFSSCLSDPDPYQTLDGIFKVDGFLGFYKFKTAYGMTVTPTNQGVITSDLAPGSFAYILYRYDTRNVSETSTNLDAEIQGSPIPVKMVSSFGHEGMAPQENEAPFVSYQGQKEIALTRYLYDKHSLFVNLSYNVKVNKNDNSKNDLNYHDFYIWEEKSETNNPDELVLRISHIVRETTIENEETRVYNDVRCIDLTRFVQNSETKPRNIKVIYKVKDGNQSSGSEETIKLVDVNEPFKLNYEEFCNFFPKDNNQQ